MSSIAEEFEKRQNIKSKTHTTISTTINPREDHAADALSEFARFKLREQNAVYGLDTGEGEDQTAWKTFKIDLPKRYLNISEDLDRVLESSDLMKELNELCIRDTQEVYVRELLNRIDRCCRWLEANKYNWGFHMDIPIAILKNDILKIQEEYVMFRKIKDKDGEYQRDGIEILAEILGVKDE